MCLGLVGFWLTVVFEVVGLMDYFGLGFRCIGGASVLCLWLVCLFWFMVLVVGFS